MRLPYYFFSIKNIFSILLLFYCFFVCNYKKLYANNLDDDSCFYILDFSSNNSQDNSLEEDIFLAAGSNDRHDRRKNRKLQLSRTDQIPHARLAEATTSYMEGYIQAQIDANYYELQVLVYVDNTGVVFLYNLPSDARIKHSIIAFVEDIPDVEEVREGIMDPEIKEQIEERQPIRHVKGVWFPESTVLFTPLIANPRDPIYSIAYRWGDVVLAKQQIEVSLGDVFPIFRWFNVFKSRGDLQIDIAACMWAAFDMNPKVHPNGETAELITTDYLLSIPVTYAIDQWAFRFRIYHISSHLGDEFMVNNPDVPRVNPSFEVIETFASFQATDSLRLYGGPGFIINSDNSYPMKYIYLEYGIEFRGPGFRHHYHWLYGVPFFALDVQNWQVNHFRPSIVVQLGYEWSKLQGAGRKVRIFGEYHNGYSEGQFFKENTHYWAVRATWGF